jgi:hypothetical protein
MGRLIPAGTGMDYYRRVKIAGEDIPEEEAAGEPEVLEAIPGYDEETRTLYSGGLSEDTGRVWRSKSTQLRPNMGAGQQSSAPVVFCKRDSKPRASKAVSTSAPLPLETVLAATYDSQGTFQRLQRVVRGPCRWLTRPSTVQRRASAHPHLVCPVSRSLSDKLLRAPPHGGGAPLCRSRSDRRGSDSGQLLDDVNIFVLD